MLTPTDGIRRRKMRLRQLRALRYTPSREAIGMTATRRAPNIDDIRSPQMRLDDGYTQGAKWTDVSDETDEIALSVALARYAFEANPWDDGGDSAASATNR